MESGAPDGVAGPRAAGVEGGEEGEGEGGEAREGGRGAGSDATVEQREEETPPHGGEVEKSLPNDGGHREEEIG